MEAINRLMEMKAGLLAWGLPVEAFDMLVEDMRKEAANG